jgi:5-methyltetrahydropteroyltriglutamate--homocysteine methyltransferase
MKRSETEILTTHTGSLPRGEAIEGLLQDREKKKPATEEEFDRCAAQAIAEVVGKQIEVGLDIINDGEQSKPSYATYIIDRISGFDGERRASFPKRLDSSDFPEWAKSRGPRGLASLRVPCCTGPIEWRHFDLVEKDLGYLKAALEGQEPREVFLSAASPGVIANMLPNEHYSGDEAYLEALGEAMRREYEAIVDAGFLLQVDCPDLAMARNSEFSHLSVAEFRKVIEMHIAVLNGALANIDPEKMRMHVCWGNYEGPHNHDVPFEDIVDIILTARPMALCIEGSNPRHGHEWETWKSVKLPDGKVIVSGCIDSTSNFVEHPELVAQRIEKYASVIGRENLIAGVDCGFGTMVGMDGVDPKVVWAKLGSLVEGARRASERLY